MKKTCSFCLLLVFFVVSCITTDLPYQETKVPSPVVDRLKNATTLIPTLTPIPSIPVESLPDKYSDAIQWKDKLQEITGKFYVYDSRDVSPDGHWFISLNYSTFLLRLIPLDNSSQAIEYQINPEDIHEMWVYSWSPDSSAFVICVNYTHNPNGCQALKIFEISPDGVLEEHNVAWDSGGYFQVLWAEYGDPIGLISPYSGVLLYNRKGSSLNHAHLRDIVDAQWVEEGRRRMILAIERPNDLTTLDFLPSKIYKLDGQTLDAIEIYKSDFPLNLLGGDVEAKYFLLEKFSSNGQQSVSLDLFELETRTVIQRYVFPPDTQIRMSASGQNLIAFEVKIKNDIEGKIWVFDFTTRRIEVRGAGTLMGWLYSNEGFLVRNKADDWILLAP